MTADAADVGAAAVARTAAAVTADAAAAAVTVRSVPVPAPAADSAAGVDAAANSTEHSAAAADIAPGVAPGASNAHASAAAAASESPSASTPAAGGNTHPFVLGSQTSAVGGSLPSVRPDRHIPHPDPGRQDAQAPYGGKAAYNPPFDAAAVGAVIGAQ